MKRICTLLLLLTSLIIFSGCSEMVQQVETIAQQIDIETVITEAIETIDWKQLEKNAKQGYDTLTEHFPALESKNIKAFLKSNGLELLSKYVESGDEGMQENARKLGEIIKILNPELTDEVNVVLEK